MSKMTVVLTDEQRTRLEWVRDTLPEDLVRCEYFVENEDDVPCYCVVGYMLSVAGVANEVLSEIGSNPIEELETESNILRNYYGLDTWIVELLQEINDRIVIIDENTTTREELIDFIDQILDGSIEVDDEDYDDEDFEKLEEW